MAGRRQISSSRANGSRECAPDDKLREAIQISAKQSRFRIGGGMDCFVALLLAMMAGGALTIRDQLLIRARVVRFLAGLHETETFLDLAEHKRQILALLRGKAGQDLLFLALQRP